MGLLDFTIENAWENAQSRELTNLRFLTGAIR